MANSKPGKNRAGKIILSRAKIFFFLPIVKEAWKLYFQIWLVLGTGCRKERESIMGLWFPCLLLLSEFLPAVRALRLSWGPEAGALCISVPTCQKVKMLLLQLGSPRNVSPQGCWSHDTHRAGPAHNLPPPPLAARRPISPHPAQQKNTMANVYPQLLGEWMSTDHFLLKTTHRSVSSTT